MDSSPNNTVGNVHKPQAMGAIDPAKKVLPKPPMAPAPKPKALAFQSAHKPVRRKGSR